ncbi:MAG: ABC transporter substrate-binding protein [Lachnospiraceae bacterium]|nr:ABC transporter substrate-binding protein [Lachnospiraceae bacterium]MBR4606885.1 ABC transporter substrate-binding protein [Lachnospiraceae bacterium]
MKYVKKFCKLVLVVSLIMCLAACTKDSAESSAGAASNSQAGEGQNGTVQPKTMKMAVSFFYPSLDVHKDYYGWYTSIYGVSETLFRIGDDLSIQPLLAKSHTVSADGKTWSFTLADAKFSNGTAVTADMVIKNFQRLAEVNERFAYLADFTYVTEGDKTLKITTPEVYPTMLSDLTAPELGIMDLEGTKDFDNAPICTGPFVVKTFDPEGTVVVDKNASYWNGEVKLDSVIFYYMQDDETKLNAMQAGDVDGYTSVTAAAKEIFEADPATYTLTVIPATRLQFYVLNKNTLDDKVREAINLTVDPDAIAAYLGGTVSAAVGPFSVSAPYGKVKKPAVDTAKAKKLLEEDGYVLGSDGYYAKNGETLTLNVCYYAARSLDTIAVIMQDEFKSIGVKATLTVQEDPDATYIATGDYDVALYCMIADKAGDPYYCVSALFRQESKWALGGFANAQIESLINELQYETDVNKRASLANQIVQKSIDDNAFGYIGLFNKTTVTSKGLTGIAENCPFDFYGITAATDKN